MATLKYNNKDVDPGQNFDKPFPAGVYPMQIDTIEMTTSKKSQEPMLKVTLSVKSGEHKGRKVWEYIVQDDSQAFRMRQLTDALGVKPDGAIMFNEDTKLVSKIGGKKVEGATLKCNVKIEPGDENFPDPSNKIKNFLKKGADSEEPEEEEEEEVEEPEATAEEPEGEDGEVTHAELEALSRKELKEWAKENESEVKFTKGKSTEDLLAAICEEFGIEAEEPEEEEEEEEESEAEDYSDMTLADLKEKCEEKDISPKGTKKVLVKRLEKADEAGGGSEDDGSEPF